MPLRHLAFFSFVLVKVPSREFIDSLKGGTEKLSDNEVVQKIKILDAEYRLK